MNHSLKFKYLTIVLIVLFSSCRSQETLTINSSPNVTVVEMQTATPTFSEPQPTTSSTPTKIPATPKLVATDSFTPTKTNMVISVTPTQPIKSIPSQTILASSLSLSKTILTSNDFFQLPYTIELGNMQLYTEPRPIEKDVTDELGVLCQEDCAKRIWISNGKILLTIILVKTSSESSAQKAVKSLSEDYNITDSENYSSIEDFDKRNKEYGFSEQTFLTSIVDAQNYSIKTVLTTSHDAIYILIVDQHGWEFDVDGVMACASIQYVGKLQIEKLKNAGY
jgi:hypothetical protein